MCCLLSIIPLPYITYNNHFTCLISHQYSETKNYFIKVFVSRLSWCKSGATWVQLEFPNYILLSSFWISSSEMGMGVIRFSINCAASDCISMEAWA